MSSAARTRPGARHGVTLGLGLALPLVVDGILAGQLGELPRAGGMLAAAVAALVIVGTLGPRLPRGVADVAVALALAVAALLVAPALTTRPALALALLLGAGALLAWSVLEEPRLAAHTQARRPRDAFAWGSAGWGLALWLVVVPTGIATRPLQWAALCAALGVPLALAAARAWRGGGLARAAAGAALAVPLAVGLWGGLASAGRALGPVLLAAGAATLGLERRRARRERADPWWVVVASDPARAVVLTFLGTGLVGASVLALPACSATGRGIGWVDAVFTAFSACCVTGLTVLDTARDFSALGQGVILALIQIGGLGIMTISTAALVLLGQRVTVRHERAAAEVLGYEERASLRSALRDVLRITFAVESAGALLLTALFWRHGFSLGEAVVHGGFTAISAFCNAGFALHSQNLVPFQRSPLVLHVVALLIVLGGLGPVVIAAAPRAATRRRVTLHVRVAVGVSAALLLGGAAFIAMSEWTNALAGLDPLDRLHNAWFQSVSLRTAGFASIDLTDLRPATLTIMMVLMFIGGSPGSTAGGIKTTTFAVLLLACLAALRGREHPTVGGYSLSSRTVYRALAITVAGGLTVFGVFLALELTQAIPFEATLFEAFSAVGTVGLTVGATGALDDVGKLVVAAAMLAGRVGPLTLFVLLMREDGGSRWTRPEGQLPVG